MIIYFIRKDKSFKEIIDNVMRNNKRLERKLNNYAERDTDINNNIKKHGVSDIIFAKTDPSHLITRKIKDNSKKYLLIQNDSNRIEKIEKVRQLNLCKNNEQKITLSSNNNMIKKNNKCSYINGNIRVIYETKKINKDVEITVNDSSNVSKINKNTYSMYNTVKYIHLLCKDERFLYYSDTEMNLIDFDYKKALKIDTRSSLRYYWSIIIDNNILFYSFGIWNNNYTFLTIKIAYFIFSFNLILLINICFMNESTIYHLFEVQGKYVYF
jgi:hypothetical protein